MSLNKNNKSIKSNKTEIQKHKERLFKQLMRK